MYILYQLNKILAPDAVFVFIYTSYKLFYTFNKKSGKQENWAKFCNLHLHPLLN